MKAKSLLFIFPFILSACGSPEMPPIVNPYAESFTISNCKNTYDLDIHWYECHLNSVNLKPIHSVYVTSLSDENLILNESFVVTKHVTPGTVGIVRIPVHKDAAVVKVKIK